MTFPTQLSETPATGNSTRANEAFDTLNAFATYLKRHAATTGLTWAYWGDRWGTFSVAEGTLTLTDAADNYVVVLRSTGAISVSTSSTNWDDTTNYARVYKITTAGGVPTVVEPHYSGPGGVHGSAGSAVLTGQYTVDGTLASDDSYAGRAITGVNAGATIAQWEAVYMGSGGEWLLADATDDTAAPMRGLAAEAGTDGNPMTVVTEGVIRNDAWAWTIGGAIYLSTAAGGLTQTAPNATGEIVQPVGFAITADLMYLNVGAATFIEVA
jgi:hypothetical protein